MWSTDTSQCNNHISVWARGVGRRHLRTWNGCANCERAPLPWHSRFLGVPSNTIPNQSLHSFIFATFISLFQSAEFHSLQFWLRHHSPPKVSLKISPIFLTSQIVKSSVSWLVITLVGLPQCYFRLYTLREKPKGPTSLSKSHLCMMFYYLEEMTK